MDIKTQVKETAHQVEKFGQENVVVKTAHKGIQASLGAVALGVEEVEAVIKRLVEKGEVAEKDGRKMLDGWMSRGREPMTKYEEKVEGMLDHRIESVLQAMNIPSRNDIADLTHKITALAKKVADLDKKVAPEKKLAA
ncbi:MAG: phasin family protein [Caldilineales bacterium]|nr:phasin family protein [Caldilineales bacterium]MCW5860219.1 phasin family protein [Caldilineales bacterium]